MKTASRTPFHLVLALHFAVLSTLCAQTVPTLDPAKEADYENRYHRGQELEASGDLTGARAVFEKIISERPDAKGSLKEAGAIAFQQGDLAAASAHFEALHQLIPNYPAALEFLIQVNQALGRDIKTERLVREFRILHNSGKATSPEFASSLFFVRERTKVNGQLVVFSEFFDFNKPPDTVWMAEEISPQKELLHRILLNFDPTATAEIRAKDPRFAKAEEYLLMEQVMNGETLKSIDVYQQIFSLPDYAKVRAAMIAILTNHPKPIYSSAAAPH